MTASSKFKIGDTVLNKGTTSMYRGQTGVIIKVGREILFQGHMTRKITVRYDNGTETHPYKILEVKSPQHFEEDLFKL